METDKFKPDFSQEDRNPTSILLSHVYDLKDILVKQTIYFFYFHVLS